MPENAASGGFHRFERIGVVAEEAQAASRCQSTCPGIAWTNLWVAPDAFAIGQRKRQQDFLHTFARRERGACVVKGGALHKVFGFGAEQIATFESHRIEEPRIRIIGRRKPVCGAIDARTDVGAFWSGNSAREDWAAGRVNAGGPVQFFDERRGAQEFAVGSVEQIEKTTAIRLNQKMTDGSVFVGIHEDGSFRGVVIVDIMRGELKIPLELAGVGVQSQDTSSVEVIAGA